MSRNPVMGSATIYRLRSADAQALGRHRRTLFDSRQSAAREQAALERRTPGAVILIEQAATLDAHGHVIPLELRTWRALDTEGR
jgi:hypothetical protein